MSHKLCKDFCIVVAVKYGVSRLAFRPFNLGLNSIHLQIFSEKNFNAAN